MDFFRKSNWISINWKIKHFEIIQNSMNNPGRRILGSDLVGSYRISHNIRCFPTGIPTISDRKPVGSCRNPGIGIRSEVVGFRIRWVPTVGNRRIRLSESNGNIRIRWYPTESDRISVIKFISISTMKTFTVN